MLNDDHGLAVDGLLLDLDLLVSFQASFFVGPFAHPLDGTHHVALLGKEGIAEVRRPLNIARQPLHKVRHHRHRLNARVPMLLYNFLGEELLVFVHIGILLEPLMELDKLQRVGRRN